MMFNDPSTPWAERNGAVAWLRKHSIFLVLITTFIAFLLLTLTSFSLPLTKSLYFLHASQAGGVRFGIWGWCLETDPICINPLHLGYTWEPQIGNTITKALVLYPLAAILSLLALVALIPIHRHRTIRTDRVFAVFAIIAFVISLLAFMFMIGIWGAAKSRFEKAGFKAGYGPLALNPNIGIQKLK
ncbi:hypothetical protein BDQ12DRAFT_497477 [Crucibulum laeve]|uniref:SUR7/PalI family-domain-containing protein n=1 Tax=Crucibulum laeve TaxID=68775 RepID=A0A5C3M4V4_9AGAR|nr:hypothetical protein BDQ12DRAFT_497477 [Crucibulum laeve]